MRRLAKAAIAVLIIGAVFFAIGRAWGASLVDEDQAWPKGEIPVYSQSSRTKSIPKAIQDFNGLGLGVSFRMVQSPQEARILVEDTKHFNPKCSGKGVVGCTLRGYHSDQKNWLQLEAPTRNIPDHESFSQVVIHEFIHVLGVGHRKGKCLLMSEFLCESKEISFQQDSGCPIRPRFGLQPSEWCPGVAQESYLCKPTKTELEELVRLYGGRIPPDYSPWCKTKQEYSWTGDCIHPEWKPLRDLTPARISSQTGTCAKNNPRYMWEYLQEAREAAWEVQRKTPLTRRQSINQEIRRLEKMSLYCPDNICLGKRKINTR